MKFNKLGSLLLAGAIAIGSIAVPVSAATPARETVTVNLKKLMYEGDKKEDFIQNTGKELTIDDASVEAYDPAKYGDVEFTVFVSDTIQPGVVDSKSSLELAKEVETAYNNKTELPYGFKELKTVAVNQDGSSIFENVEYNKEQGYVFVETKSSSMVKEKANPIFVMFPMTNADGRTYFDDEVVYLYPKNNVQKLKLDFTKYARFMKDDQEAPIEGVQFKLYIGEKGQGQPVQENGQDKIYVTDANGVITVNDLLKGKYYLVEQETKDIVDGMLVDATDVRTDVGELLVSGVAQNDANNQLGFEVDANGTITTDEVFAKYINYERPRADKEILDKVENVEPNYSIGEDIKQQVTLTVPANIRDYSKFGFTDTLTIDGQPTKEVGYIQDSVQVTVDGVVLAKEDYTIVFNADNNSFNIEFVDADGLTDKITNDSKNIVVSYSSEFLAGAKPVGNYANEILFRYNNSKHNNNKDRFEKDKETFTTYGFKVKKVDNGVFKSDLLKQPLEGAKFILLDAEGKAFRGINEDTKTPLFGDIANALELVSDKDGIVEVDGLKAGTYTLREVQAPKDYKLPQGEKADFTIVVNEKSHELGAIEDITNMREDGLPITGTEQMVIFTSIGFAGLALAGVVFVVNERKKKQEA